MITFKALNKPSRHWIPCWKVLCPWSLSRECQSWRYSGGVNFCIYFPVFPCYHASNLSGLFQRILFSLIFSSQCWLHPLHLEICSCLHSPIIKKRRKQNKKQKFPSCYQILFSGPPWLQLLFIHSLHFLIPLLPHALFDTLQCVFWSQPTERAFFISQHDLPHYEIWWLCARIGASFWKFTSRRYIPQVWCPVFLLLHKKNGLGLKFHKA